MPNSNQQLYAKRANRKFIFESMRSPFVTAILGPRRVGKSTFIQHYKDKHPDLKWVSFNMDIRSQRLRIAEGRLREEIEQQAMQPIGQSRSLWVSIDEAQKCPELFEQIKVIYDDFKDTGSIKFVLTGSASLDLHNLSAESLAGRIELINLREFTIQEQLMLKHEGEQPETSILSLLASSPEDLEEAIQHLSPYQRVLQEAIDYQLVYGGLPELMFMQSDSERWRYLDQYIQSYLEKDVRKIAEITNLDLYQKLLEALAEHTGSLRDDTRLLESLGCARNTLKKYRGYLVATNIFHEVFPIMNDTLKRIIKSPKGYITNNGIISMLTGLDEITLLKKSGHIGHRFENWFLKELQVWLDREVKRHRIYFWQMIGGQEIDFIVERKPNIIPFEVTYSNRIESKKLKNLAMFLQKSKRANMGVLIYNGEYVYKPDLNIHCIPAWAIC